MREHLEGYSDAELSLRVFNVEELYLQRHGVNLDSTLRERFTFTDAQLAELRDDLRDEDWNERH
jgi:hypothetical protein